MGRQANAVYRPFRGKRDGVEYGNYRWYNPFTKNVETITPETEDFDTAWNRTRLLIEMGTGNGRGGQAGGAPETTTDTPVPSFSKLAGEAMDSWVLKDDGKATAITDTGRVQSESATGTSPAPPKPIAPSQATAIRPVAPTVSPKPPKKGALTPEQSARMARGMKNLVVKVNLMSLGGIVRFAGKDPYELDEEDIELLSLGWELTLDEFFVKNPPKPWMLILAGNLMCASVMYMRGTDIVKAEDILITEGEPQGAPGHERNAT